VQRQASRQAQRPRVLGLTAPDFVGVATPELQVWLRWWGAGGWTPEGPGEPPPDPKRVQKRIRAELIARERRAGAGGGRSTRS
jgi:hypothetical protein